ncbi:MAG: hypothetical protein KDH88_05745, partial [Chromatiales bacterium]|nr:hypothetical protein [Chromatiales bacterium]
GAGNGEEAQGEQGSDDLFHGLVSDGINSEFVQLDVVHDEDLLQLWIVIALARLGRAGAGDGNQA